MYECRDVLKITVLCIGKSNEAYLAEGIEIFLGRLKHYCKFELKVLADVKKFGDDQDLMDKEALLFLQNIKVEDYLVVCDELGKQMSSVAMSQFIQMRMNESTKHLIFLVGGAFGISKSLKQRANFTLSLSAMTFSHQMIRLFLIEQVYRAFTIIKNEKYHNP